jgi:hypothetical protein
MNVSIHEDNLGVLVLSKTLLSQFMPQSKYYTVKTIWICEEIFKRGIQLLKIDTVKQLGVIYTKGLTQVVFKYL